MAIREIFSIFKILKNKEKYTSNWFASISKQTKSGCLKITFQKNHF